MWTLTLTCLDNNDAAKTLYFSDIYHIDNSDNEHEPRIITPALVSISGNDGGVLNIFDTPSIGDIELSNKDGALNYLVTYAIDGRAAEIKYNGTVIYKGVASRLSESGDRIRISFKAEHEALSDNFPMSIYLGNNALPLGLEGDSELTDKPKPLVFGDCRNITATLVNSSLLIYQVSSRSDCRITAVYDDGVRLVNYRSGNHNSGVSTITVSGGYGDIALGKHVMFGNHSTVYEVTTGLSGGSIVISPALTAAVNNTAIDIIDWYANTTALQDTGYQVNGDHLAGDVTIAAHNGVGAIDINDLIMFSGDKTLYKVKTALSGGSFELFYGLTRNVNDGEYIINTSNEPALWGSYQGYFRLSATPAGTITCDAAQLTSGEVTKCGDVFKDIAEGIGLTADNSSVTTLNNEGIIGLYVSELTPTVDLLNKLIKSVSGFYYIDNAVLYASLISAPGTEIFTIEDYQIKRIERMATGLGSNGLPIKKIVAKWDKIETVQTTLAGGVSDAWRERLKNEFRESVTEDGATATRHLLALALELETLLRTGVVGARNRLLNVVKARRDVVTVEAIFAELPDIALGDTVKVITPRLGYNAGRKFVVIGKTIDQKHKTITLKGYG
jgi:hypothetical protein